MHLFIRTLYLIIVMVTTAMVMLVLLLCIPDVHNRLSVGVYRQKDLSYSQMIQNSLYSSGVYTVEGGDSDTRREAPWRYDANNTGYLKFVPDYTRPRFQPWPHSYGCAALRVQFGRMHTLPTTALASFPGSGNTWVRYLVQGATGIFTGSVYKDRHLQFKGFYGESEPPECGCTIAVKTHGFCLSEDPSDRLRRMQDLERYHGRGILLIRNPYDTLISFRNFLHAGHLGLASKSFFIGKEWDNFVQGQIGLWKEYALDWIAMSRYAIVVHYELLRRSPREELLRILDFLRIKVDLKRLECVLTNVEGDFRRRIPAETFYLMKDPFNYYHHMVIRRAILEVNAALRRREWTLLPLRYYSYYNEMENGLSYGDNSTSF